MREHAKGLKDDLRPYDTTVDSMQHHCAARLARLPLFQAGALLRVREYPTLLDFGDQDKGDYSVIKQFRPHLGPILPLHGHIVASFPKS